VLRRLFGVLGTVLAAAGAGVVVSFLVSSLLLGGIAGLVVFVLATFGGPMMAVSQVLGGRGGGFSGGLGSGGGGFGSGGGGDFSGGGASGSW